MGLGAGLRLAVGTLTMVPVGEIGTPTRSTARWSMVLAPLAVLPLGTGSAVIVWAGAVLTVPRLAVAVLVVGALALGTRAMHLDGLADTADGIGAGWDRDRALEVMRRGDVGPMGVAALVVVLALQVASLSTVAGRPLGWATVAAAVVASRSSLALACAQGIRPAREGGLGAVVAGSVPAPVVVVSLLVSCALLGVAGSVDGDGPWRGVVAALVGCAGAAAVLRTCVRTLGGVTGDVMGACVEVSFAGMLLALASGGVP